MKMLTSIVIVFAAVVSARADTWSADHAKCYSEMMQFQVLSRGYLSGETKEKTIERLGANGIPALIKKIDLVYGDKPTDFDEYGATIFFVVQEPRVSYWTKSALELALLRTFLWHPYCQLKLPESQRIR